MIGFTLLWAKMLDSSVWVKESKETRLLWVTVMMMKNSKGQIHSSVLGLGHRARLAPYEVKESLRILLAPDPDDTSGVEEGRRLREIPGGWEVVNHDLYRFSTDEKREFWREQKREQREKKSHTSKVQQEKNKERRKTATDKAKKTIYKIESERNP